MKNVCASMRSKKGFTLIELIVVIALIAISATLVVPNFSKITSRADVNKYSSYCSSARTTVEAYVQQAQMGIKKIKIGENERSLTTLAGFQTIFNETNTQQNFSYYVVSSKTAPNSSDISSVKKKAEIYKNSSFMIICIEGVGNANNVRLYGMWFYDYEKNQLAYSYNVLNGHAKAGAYNLTSL